jgi:hypothetical protein
LLLLLLLHGGWAVSLPEAATVSSLSVNVDTAFPMTATTPSSASCTPFKKKDMVVARVVVEDAIDDENVDGGALWSETTRFLERPRSPTVGMNDSVGTEEDEVRPTTLMKNNNMKDVMARVALGE